MTTQSKSKKERPEPQYYTYAQAARAVGVSRQRINRRVLDGDIRVVRAADVAGGAALTSEYLIPAAEVRRLQAEADEHGNRPRGGGWNAIAQRETPLTPDVAAALVAEARQAPQVQQQAREVQQADAAN